MNIIIVGSGTVGAAICSELVRGGHDVTVIDISASSIAEITNSCDVTGLVGNGTDIKLLREAGAETADMLIAITMQDEINMLCCYAAKKLGTTHTVARVRNPEYSSFMEFMKDDMALSLTINPEFAVAKELQRMIKFPAATRVDTFCHGKVEIAEFTVSQGSPLCDLSLYDLRNKFNIKFLVCGVQRDDEVFIPSGNFVIKAGDNLCVTGADGELVKFFKAAGAYRKPIKKILITGGGRTTYYLAELLGKALSGTTIIEKDINVCRELSESFNIDVIHGDGTKQELLLEEGIEKADAFLALSDVDEENAIVSMYAKNLGVPRVVTMIRSLPYIDFFSDVGLESIVSPKSSTVDYIIRFVRSLDGTKDSEIESFHSMMDGKIEAAEFKIKEQIEGLTEIPIFELKRKKNCLLACIVRRNDIIIGDRIIVLTAAKKLTNVKDILA